MACVMACVVACVVAKSAKFFDRINYNLDWIVCGCCVRVVAKRAKGRDAESAKDAGVR